KTNENHCGACFNRCEAGEDCVRGECGGTPPPCPPEEKNCCTCFYTSTTTPGESVSTCNPEFTGGFSECDALCRNSEPPPGTEFNSASIAEGGASERMLVCGPPHT